MDIQDVLKNLQGNGGNLDAAQAMSALENVVSLGAKGGVPADTLKQVTQLLDGLKKGDMSKLKEVGPLLASLTGLLGKNGGLGNLGNLTNLGKAANGKGDKGILGQAADIASALGLGKKK